jgi:protoheme IX farnesyltransferase
MDHVSPPLSSNLTIAESIKNYLLITKPGIIAGNLVSVTGGFLLASQGHVDIVLLLATLLGIALVIASGCVFNNSLDRDIDQVMSRTRNRALASGLISNHSAEFYAAILGIIGISLLWAATNLLTVAIVFAGFVVYVGVYTMYLKRSSSHAALIGSIAGATPPLAGYCAVTGQFDIGALILLAIFSLWQMPHFYAIAIYRLEDYRNAAIPVLPVKRGIAVTKRHIISYIFAFIIASLALTFLGYTGYWYLTAALITGAGWLYFAFSGYRKSTERKWARKLFAYSIVIVIVTNIMISVDFVTPEVSQNDVYASQTLAESAIVAP